MQANTLFNFIPSTVMRNTFRLYARNNRKIQNPGLQNRIDLLNENQDSNPENIDFEELETDFMNVNQTHREHEKEMEYYKEKEKFWIVKRKYFKEEHVNFLTWSDKEQIRHLHNTNPNEWTIEKLSEGFPALPNTIAKIAHGKWQPKNEDKKKNHDQAVDKNWKLLKNNKLSNLPQQLIQHITKFSNRKPNLELTTDKIIIKEQKQPRLESGEFSSIIENYNNLKNNKNDIASKTQINKFESDRKPETRIESIKPASKTDQRLLTLKELRSNISENIESGNIVDEYDKMILKESPRTMQNDTDNKNVDFSNFNTNLMSHKQETNIISSKTVDQKVLESLNYPNKIIVPKEKYKKGLTYKVNDCYYDDDGEFLYRVPGMY